MGRGSARVSNGTPSLAQEPFRSYWPKQQPLCKGRIKNCRKDIAKDDGSFPNEGVAFNNLAQVLWEQGKKQEALKTAHQAVTLGGPFVEKYQKTLDEIRSDTP